METPPHSHNHPCVDHWFVLISLIFPHNEAANEKNDTCSHPTRAPTTPFACVTCETTPFNHTLCQNLRSRPREPLTWGNTGPFGRRGPLEAPRGRQCESTRPKPTICPWTLTQWRWCWRWLRCVTRAQGYDPRNPFGSKLSPFSA